MLGDLTWLPASVHACLIEIGFEPLGVQNGVQRGLLFGVMDSKIEVEVPSRENVAVSSGRHTNEIASRLEMTCRRPI